MEKSLQEKVREIVAEHLNLNKDLIIGDLSFSDDLGLDSLDMVELIMRLEEEFDIGIQDADAKSVKTVSDTVDLINRKIM